MKARSSYHVLAGVDLLARCQHDGAYCMVLHVQPVWLAAGLVQQRSLYGLGTAGPMSVLSGKDQEAGLPVLGHLSAGSCLP